MNPKIKKSKIKIQSSDEDDDDYIDFKNVSSTKNDEAKRSIRQKRKISEKITYDSPEDGNDDDSEFIL